MADPVGKKGGGAEAAGAQPAPQPRAPAPAPGGTPQQLTLQYVDLPGCSETFADSVMGVVFDGQTLRIEFAITRLDEVKPNAPLTGRRYPVCRLVLTPAATGELFKRMQQVSASIAQAMQAAPKPGEAPKATG